MKILWEGNLKLKVHNYTHRLCFDTIHNKYIIYTFYRDNFNNGYWLIESDEKKKNMIIIHYLSLQIPIKETQSDTIPSKTPQDF